MKKLIFTLCTVILVTLGAAIGMELFHTEPLTIEYNTISSAKVELVDAVGKRTPLSSGNPIELRKGDYTIAVSGSDIAPQTTALTIDNEPVTKELSVSYTDDYLSNQLTGEYPAIRAALLATYPQLEQLYVIKPGYKLYLDGNWFAARLRYIGKDDVSRDTLKVVLHKKDDTWTVVTKPPQIFISKVTYPGIPEPVVKDINSDEVIRRIQTD